MNSDNNLGETKSRIGVDNNDTRQYWKVEEEKLLEEWADKAQCFEYMHQKTHNIYKKKNGYYTIPVIIISTITGTANFAQERIPADYISIYVMVIGSLNIIAGILTTIYQYFKISELNESNRIAYLSWGKYYRDIKTELSKHPFDRTKPKELLKFSKNEYDRLIEISPAISQSTIDNFNKKVNKEDTDELRKPEICDTLTATTSFSLTNEEREEIKMLAMRITEEQNKVDIEDNPSQRFKNQKMEQLKKSYFELNNREPSEDELNELYNSVYDTPQVNSTEI